MEEQGLLCTFVVHLHDFSSVVATCSLSCQLCSLFPNWFVSCIRRGPLKKSAWNAELQGYACVCMYVLYIRVYVCVCTHICCMCVLLWFTVAYCGHMSAHQHMPHWSIHVKVVPFVCTPHHLSGMVGEGV